MPDINPVQPSGMQMPGDYQQMKNWLQGIDQWAKQYPIDAFGLQSWIGAIKTEIQGFLNGTHGYKSIVDVLNDLKAKFIRGSGNCDLYSGFDNAQAAQDFMKIFGIVLPPPTKMDELMMKVTNEARNGNIPAGASHVEMEMFFQMVRFGSEGLNEFQTWLKQEMNTAEFKAMQPEDQAWFNQFLV